MAPHPADAELDSALGRAIVEAARGLDPLAARTVLHNHFPDASADLIRAATVQAELAERAVGRFGPMAREVLWSSDGLEQASRPSTSRHRAATLATAGVTQVADLTCGLGLDALAFAGVGMSVFAVEQDPATAALAAVNGRRLGDGRVEVAVGSCTDSAVLHRAETADAWFVDPSRRSGQRGRDGRHRRLDDPEQWSPPWSWVLTQARRVGAARLAAPSTPRVLMVKAAPGLPHEAIAQVPGCRVAAEWVSQDGHLLETSVAWWRAEPVEADEHPSADTAPLRRSAVILDAEGNTLVRMDGAAARATTSSQGPSTDGTRPQPPATGEYLFDPDPAIVRAGVVAELAAAGGARLIDPHLAYLASHTPLPHVLRPAARAWRILESGPYGAGRLRASCAEHGIGHIEVTGRGRHLEPARVRRDLTLPGGGQRGILVVMALGPARTTLVCLCLAA